MKNKLLCILVFIITNLVVTAQEKLVPLVVNPTVRKAYTGILKHTAKSLLTPDTLSLPFLDDFSTFRVYPDPAFWSDRDVFVNQTLGVSPPTIGVATLDAINEKGSLYPDAEPFPFIADHLTSKPLYLNYSPASNIFFSFYYQPQGLGDFPNQDDSLCLDFYAPLQQTWHTVWNIPGDSLAPDTITPFRMVILPVQDTAFLHAGFRFRFRNYASISYNSSDPGRVGNCDQWNIDYVYLDRDRFKDDTVMHDVAITSPLKSVLKTYEAMPWRHFRETYLTEMGSFLPVTYRNNDTIVRNVTRQFEITDLFTGQQSHAYTGGAVNIGPLTTETYTSPLIYTFNSPAPDSVVFRVRSYLITDNYDPKINDTVTYYQVFRDYFAYDDGSAEAGYGLSGNGMDRAAVAIRFHAYKPDTLQAIRIYFNESWKDANSTTFNLMVWAADGDNPGENIYQKISQSPVFRDSLNCFTTYFFDSAVVIPEGDFYVGWQQNSSVFLNVGFDRNRNNQDKNQIYVSGQWLPSTIPGSIMIRPVTGHNLLASVPSHEPDNKDWTVYPQPAKDHLYIKYNNREIQNPEYILLDMTGRILYRHKGFTRTVNISGLHNGFYLLVVRQNDRPVYRTRFVISR